MSDVISTMADAPDSLNRKEISSSSLIRSGFPEFRAKTTLPETGDRSRHDRLLSRVFLGCCPKQSIELYETSATNRVPRHHLARPVMSRKGIRHCAQRTPWTFWGDRPKHQDASPLSAHSSAISQWGEMQTREPNLKW